MCTLKKEKFVGSQIFEVKDQMGTFPFDLEFDVKNPKNDKEKFKGSGIYIITYETKTEKPIYIGLFRPFYRDDVRKVRWKKHIKTFTHRGYNLGISKKVHDSIEDKCPKMQSIKIKSTGCQTSKNRLKFAYKHWDKFNVGKDKLQDELKNFKFYYYQLSSPLQNVDQVKYLMPNIAAALESYLIASYKPECNKEGGKEVGDGVTVDKIEEEMKLFIESINGFKLNFVPSNKTGTTQ